MKEILLQASQIKKSFGAVKALKGVSFSLGHKEGLGLIGENGAGKSTLMKIMSGIYSHRSFEGEILLNGREMNFQGTKDAEKEGISIVHQELNLFPELTVSENIFLSHLPTNSWGMVDFSLINQKTEELLIELEASFSPSTKVGDLTNGHQQLVEIAKALSLKAQILILDEPTSSLTQKETQNLFKVIRNLQKKGMSFIYISHKLEEVFSLCNSVTVLRDGESVYSSQLKGLTIKDLIPPMVGRDLDQLYPSLKIPLKREHLKAKLEIQEWTAFDQRTKKYRVQNVSFKAYPGEILGISGMMGSGRTELCQSLFGSSHYKTEGKILLDNKPLTHGLPFQMISQGMALVTEDRKRDGLHLNFSIQDNLSMAALKNLTHKSLIGSTLNQKKIRPVLEELVSKLHIKVSSLLDPVKTLSGGNQQKVAIGKWLATNPKIIFLDEPTRGIDIGAKWEIYELLNKCVDEGLLIIIVSSELPEIMGLCHKVIVMKEGKITGTFVGQERSETSIMNAALGG